MNLFYKTMKNNIRTLLILYFLGAFVRFILMKSEFQMDIANRIEITTPLNSNKRVIEGMYHKYINVDPYTSDIVHESPWFLQYLIYVMEKCGHYFPYVFIFFDIMTAHGLYVFVNNYMLITFIKQSKNRMNYAPDADNQLLSGTQLSSPALYTIIVYLFNPYSILNCVAMTTTTFSNWLLAMFFSGLVSGTGFFAALILAISTTISFYPVILISPLYLRIYKYNSKSHRKALLYTGASLLFATYLLIGSNELTKGSHFICQTYEFILTVADQQPNVGVFWYFFMEMFEHFRLLFIYSYQMNVTVLYFIPLSIKFRKDPALLAACFSTLIAIFKSYPSIGDFAFTMALLPCWKHLYSCMQQIFMSCVTILVTTALAPILWDLWIYWGTANANFFFGATLAFVTAHIFLLTDISFAYTKRKYLLRYGYSRKINGKDAKLVLT